MPEQLRTVPPRASEEKSTPVAAPIYFGADFPYHVRC